MCQARPVWNPWAPRDIQINDPACHRWRAHINASVIRAIGTIIPNKAAVPHSENSNVQ